MVSEMAVKRNNADGRAGLVARSQVRALLAQARVAGLFRKDVRSRVLVTVFKRGGYAYYTDRFTVVRWELEQPDAIPDGSWIPLASSAVYDGDYKRAGVGGVRSLDDWAKTAKPSECLDLNVAGNWYSKPNAFGEFPAVERFFTGAYAMGVYPGVAFNPAYVSNLSGVVNYGKFPSCLLQPSAEGGSVTKPWFLTGNDVHVVSMIVPMKPEGVVGRDVGVLSHDDTDVWIAERKTAKAAAEVAGELAEPVAESDHEAASTVPEPEAEGVAEPEPETTEFPEAESEADVLPSAEVAAGVVADAGMAETAVVPVGKSWRDVPELVALGVKPRVFGKLHHRVAYVFAAGGRVVVAWKDGYAKGSDLEIEGKLSGYVRSLGLAA